MKRLEEIEARLSAAIRTTDEEWYWNGNEVVRLSEPLRGIAGIAHNEPDETAVLIANAPADLRYLLDFVKAAREALEFYAKPEHWAYKVAEELDDPLVHHDGGRIASEALALLESP